LGTNKQDPKRQQFSFDGVVPSILVFKDDGITVEKINNPTILQAELFCTSARLWYPPSYPDSLRKIKSIIHNQE
jgi:hypothetical protein